MMNCLEKIVLSFRKAMDFERAEVEDNHLKLYDDLKYYFENFNLGDQISFLDEAIELIQTYVEGEDYEPASIWYKITMKKVKEKIPISLYTIPLEQLEKKLSAIAPFFASEASVAFDGSHGYRPHY